MASCILVHTPHRIHLENVSGDHGFLLGTVGFNEVKMTLVKDILWKTAQERILHKKSTTELKKQEDIDKVFDHLVRHLGEKFFIEVPPFPHYDDKDQAIML